jgi:hypothetical protein
MSKEEIDNFLREAARKGGKSKSPAKLAAVRKNLEKANRARKGNKK